MGTQTMKIRTQCIALIAMFLLAGLTCLSGCAASASMGAKSGMMPGESREPLQAFASACASKAPAAFCEALGKRVFNNSSPIQEFSPHDFEVLDYPTDSGTLFLKLYAPKFASAIGYCYFVSKGRIDPGKIDPHVFSLNVHGFAISSADLPAYETWLRTVDGGKCRQKVEHSVGLAVVDLKDHLKNKVGIVALNPLGMVKATADLNHVMNEMRLTLNHERIHILQTVCPALNDFVDEAWDKLDPAGKADFRKRVSTSTDQQVILREYLAYTYENDPSPLFDKVKKCKF